MINSQKSNYFYSFLSVIVEGKETDYECRDWKSPNLWQKVNNLVKKESHLVLITFCFVREETEATVQFFSVASSSVLLTQKLHEAKSSSCSELH